MRNTELKPNHIGTFELPWELVESVPWLVLSEVFTGMLVLKADFSFDTRAFVYTALSLWFDQIPECSPAPRYALEVIHRTERGQTIIEAFKFIRRSE